MLNAQNLTTYDLTPTSATRAADIRVTYNFRTPDTM